MKHSIFLLCGVMCFFAFSCKKSNGVSDSTDKKAVFYTASSIDTTRQYGALYYTIKPGSFNVFYYEDISPDSASIGCGSPEETVVFQVPPEVNNFSFTNGELKTAFCFYQSYAGIAIPPPVLITEGHIEGRKINTFRWQVSGFVKLPVTGYTININTMFGSSSFQ